MRRHDLCAAQLRASPTPARSLGAKFETSAPCCIDSGLCCRVFSPHYLTRVFSNTRVFSSTRVSSLLLHYRTREFSLSLRCHTPCEPMTHMCVTQTHTHTHTNTHTRPIVTRRHLLAARYEKSEPYWIGYRSNVYFAALASTLCMPL